MGQIEKGRVASIDGATALVKPSSTVMVSSVVVVPERLQGRIGKTRSFLSFSPTGPG